MWLAKHGNGERAGLHLNKVKKRLAFTISTFCQPLFCVTFESYCSETASLTHKPLRLLTLPAFLSVLCEKKGRDRAPQPIAGLLLAGVHSNRRPVLLLFPRFVNHYFVFVLYLTLPRNDSLLHTP